MEKKNTGMKVAIVILSILVVGLLGYVLYDKVLNTDDIIVNDNSHIEENKKEEIINNGNNQVIDNNTNGDSSIDINKLYNIGKSDYNFIKREYTSNSSFNLSTDGKVYIGFDKYMSNISNASDILLDSNLSVLYILTKDGLLYKYDTNNNGNNYTAAKVEGYSNVVKMINYTTNKANGGGCSYLVIIDTKGNYYTLNYQCV